MSLFEKLKQRAIRVTKEEPVRIAFSEFELDDGTLRDVVKTLEGEGIVPFCVSTSEIRRGGQKVSTKEISSLLGPAVERGRPDQVFTRAGSIAYAACMAKLGYVDVVIGGKFVSSKTFVQYTKFILPPEPDKPVSALYLAEIPASVPVIAAEYRPLELGGKPSISVGEIISRNNYFSDHFLAITSIGIDEGVSIESLVEQVVRLFEFYNTSGTKPRIAMISYSTNGSGVGKSVDIIREVAKQARERTSGGIISDDCQLDAAVDKRIAVKKGSPFSEQGPNILIYPNIVAARASYDFIQWYFDGAQGMQGKVLACSDIVSNVNPDEDTLAAIATSSENYFRALTQSEPRLVILGDESCSEKVRAAHHSTMIYPREASIQPTQFTSNIRVFPNLNAANNYYKLIQWLIGNGTFLAMNSRFSDRSRGDNADNIIRAAYCMVLIIDTMRKQGTMPKTRDIFKDAAESYRKQTIL